jgi:ribonuclease BN (tRNA processing enzyme)
VRRPKIESRAATGPKKSARKVRHSRKGISQIVLLGTGTPGPDPLRSGPSLAIVANDEPYLVDFGPGVVRRAAAAYDMGVRGLATHQLTRAFLTHLHSDHTAGYPDLILTPWVMGRSEPLHVFGPPGLTHMTEHLLIAYQADIDQRLNGLEPANTTGYQVESHEIVPGRVYEDDNLEVHAFEVSHGTWTAYGYKFICPDRTIVVSGDTSQHENVVKAAKGCDVLIHEVCSAMGLSWRSPDWQRYHSTYHTLGPELAEIAARAKPGLLVLTHQLFQGVSESDLLREIREGYNGPILSGKDLDVF